MSGAVDPKELYQDLRCLEGDEVRDALREISRDRLALRSLLKIWSRPLSSIALARTVLGVMMWFSVRNVHTNHDLHDLIVGKVRRFVMKSIDSLEVKGLEHVVREKKRFLFISNHRDIILDPLLLNISLFDAGSECARVATGDNLWELPRWGVLLLKAIGCFTVERLSGSSRTLYRSYRQLSSYIQHLLQEQNRSVWLAQQAGRAKEGMDYTDPAVLKMLHMSSRPSSFADFSGSLFIAPTTVSYEYDPCALQKAERLAAEQEGRQWELNYTAEVHTGLMDYKGRVRLHIGEPLQERWETPEQMAQTLDEKISANYRLWPSNFAAARRLKMGKGLECPWSEEEVQAADRQLTQQQSHLSCDAARLCFWQSYANPVRIAAG